MPENLCQCQQLWMMWRKSIGGSINKGKKGQSASDTEAIKREVTMYNNDSSCILAILLGFIAAIVFGGICIGSIFIGWMINLLNRLYK